MIYQLYKKQVEAWKERFVNNRREDGEDVDAPPYPSLRDERLLSSRHKDTIELIEAEIERKRGMRREEFIESFDNDGHRYQIPKSKVDEWFRFNEIPSDDERSWDVPEWADRIDGMPISDNRGYNSAIDEDIAYLEEQLKLIKKEI